MAMFGKDKNGRSDHTAVASPPPGAEPAVTSHPSSAAPRPQLASPAAKPETTESVFGPTLVFKGEINFQDAIRIEGEIHGRIMGEGRVTVARGGKVFGDIVAAQVLVHGIVQGNVTAADRLEVATTGEIGGNLKASRLTIAEGAKLIGRLDVGSESMTLPLPAERHAAGHSASGKGADAEAALMKDALEKVF